MKDLGNLLQSDGATPGSSGFIGPTTPGIDAGFKKDRDTRVSNALSNTASAVSGLFQIGEGFERARQIETTAESLDFQAKQELNIGKAQQLQASVDLNKSLANVLVATGASGLNVSGTPGVTASQVVKQGDIQIGFIKRGSELRSIRAGQQAKVLRQGKSSAKIAGFVRAFGTFTGAFNRKANRG